MNKFNGRFISVFLLLSLSFISTDVLSEAGSSLDQSSAGKLINVTGSVEVQADDNDQWLPTVNGQLLQPGDSIKTGRDGKASLIMSDETMIQLNRNTHFQLRQVERNAGWFSFENISSDVKSTASSLYEVFTGKIWARNKNRKVSAKFKTPSMTAGIRGTELTIEVDGDTARTVIVEGKVEHINEFGRVVAEQGESVVATIGSAPIKQLIVQPLEAVQWTLLLPPVFDEKAIEIDDIAPEQQKMINDSISAGRYFDAVDKLDEAREAVLLQGHESQELQVLDAILELYTGSPLQAHNKLVSIQSSGYVSGSFLRALSISSLLTNDESLAYTSAVQAMRFDPTAPSSILVMAYVHQSRYELDEARVLLQRLVDQGERNVQARIMLAQILFASGFNDDSWEMVEDTLTIDPDNAYANNLAGFILLAMRDHEAATVAFNKALAKDAGIAESHMGLGLIAMRGGDVDEALEQITTAVALEPQRAIFLSYWGKMLYQVKRFDKALDMFEHADKLDPNDPTPSLYKSIIYRDLNRPGDAIRSMNESIEKNDNRGVYRSRFMLDEDLATRNVDLSILYQNLGLSRWAEAKAVSAIKQDYTNYSAHLFLAGILAEEENRSYTFGSEILLARLMQPANVNTFNTFNEYTSLFEQPEVASELVIGVGTQDTAIGELSANGALPEADLAWEIGVLGSTTEGWRETNFQDTSAASLITKWDPDENNGILFSTTFSRIDQGDKLYPRYEIDDPASPNDDLNLEFKNIELGYHHQFSPGSDLLLYSSWTENVQESIVLVDSFLAVAPALYVDTTNLTDFEQPSTQLQLQYMKKLADHQLITGVVGYDADVSVKIIEQTDFVVRDTDPPTVVPALTNELADNEVDVSFISYYIQDNWSISADWYVEAALYYDKMDNASAANDTEWTIEEVNPRFGLIWTPGSQHTIRLAAFRYLLPFVSSRTDPTEVAGISIFRNATEGTLTKEVDLVWELEQSYGLYSFNLFALESKEQINKINFLESEKKGGHLGLDMLLSQSTGLFANYRYEDVTNEFQPDNDRKDHLLTVGVKYQADNGFSAGINQILRETRFENNSDDETIPITDIQLGYEFPDKTGRVDLTVANVFDEEFNWVVDNFAQVGRNPAREALLRATFNF